MDQRLEQRFLRRDVEIDRAFGDAGARRHVVEPRIRKALFGKHVESRREDGIELRLPLFLAPRAGGRRLPLRSGRHRTRL
jgi:hypothetical protein